MLRDLTRSSIKAAQRRVVMVRLLHSGGGKSVATPVWPVMSCLVQQKKVTHKPSEEE